MKSTTKTFAMIIAGSLLLSACGVSNPRPTKKLTTATTSTETTSQPQGKVDKKPTINLEEQVLTKTEDLFKGLSFADSVPNSIVVLLNGSRSSINHPTVDYNANRSPLIKLLRDLIFQKRGQEVSGATVVAGTSTPGFDTVTCKNVICSPVADLYGGFDSPDQRDQCGVNIFKDGDLNLTEPLMFDCKTKEGGKTVVTKYQITFNRISVEGREIQGLMINDEYSAVFGTLKITTSAGKVVAVPSIFLTRHLKNQK